MVDITGATKRKDERCCRNCPGVDHRTSLLSVKPIHLDVKFQAFVTPYFLYFIFTNILRLYFYTTSDPFANIDEIHVYLTIDVFSR